MSNPIKKAASSTKNFVQRHKTAVTIVAVGTVTTAACSVIINAIGKTRDEFLEEKGLKDEFNIWLTDQTEN